MTRGVLLFASNNSMIDYVKQAHFLALRIKKYMNLPVSIVTDTDIKDKLPQYAPAFDKIILTESMQASYTNKRYYDGSLSKRILPFNNGNRASAYVLTPYDETIVMDTDFIINNDILNNCFTQHKDFLIYKTATHVGTLSKPFEFERISDIGIEFYWATVFFFRKTTENKIFFDLVNHIKENYYHYRSVYQFNTAVYRNDIAFSIAIHIMNGYQKGDFVGILPGKHYYCIDRDILHTIDNETFTILVEKPDRLGEYLPVRFTESNLHVMNKFSLERAIDNQ
jgi:hypothetical protein